MTTKASEFDELADRAAVAFPEDLRIQSAACALLGRWALENRSLISSALHAVEGSEAMVEKVARAIDAAMDGADTAPPEFSRCEAAARATLKAITEEMKDA